MPLKRGTKRSGIDTISSAIPLHARIQKDLSEGSNSDNVFFDEGRGHYLPVSETSFKWRFAGGPKMAQN